MRHFGLLLVVIVSFAFKTGDSEVLLPDACSIEETQQRLEIAEATRLKEEARIAKREARRKAEVAREAKEAAVAKEAAAALAAAKKQKAAEAKARAAARKASIVADHLSVASGDLVDVARSLLGIEYTMGGKSVDSGFDCSGYVRYVFGKLGLRVGGDSRSQALEGEAVPLEAARAGDIVVFARNRGKGSVFHAGIITEAADGRLIMAHANRRNGVHELDILAHDYWREKVAGVRRVL